MQSPRFRPLAVVTDVWQDLRYTTRVLGRQPIFGAAVVLTLALGIGANSAIFALVDATLLRPLPFPDPEHLVMLWERTPASPRSRVSTTNLHDWQQRSHSFDGMALVTPNVGGMVMSGIGPMAETVPRQWVSATVFDVLGITPVAGRTFNLVDLRQGANVAVFSEAFWRARFNADSAIVGKAIRFDGDLFTIVGIMPKEADMIGRANMWALARSRYPEAPSGDSRGAYLSQAIGRLKPGVTLEMAQQDLTSVAAQLAREFPKTNAGRTVTIERFDQGVIGSDLRRSSVLFLGVVGFVLFICCANVANLLMTRAIGRRRELAMRTALGAGRSRLVRQLLTEALMLAGLGGLTGVAIGAAILQVAPSVIPPDLLPAGVTLAFDLRVLVFCGVTALAVGLLFGLAPAWQATQLSAAQVIGAGSRTTTGRGGALRGALVAGQVATAVVLLFGAGLLLRTMLNVEAVDRGYRAESALSMIVDPPFGGEKLMPFYNDVERETRAQPGVRSVTWASTLPLGRFVPGRVIFRDRRGHAAAGWPASDRRLSDRQPDILRNTRPANRHRPRIRRPRHAGQPAGVHGQRSLCARIPARAIAGRHAYRDPADVVWKRSIGGT